MSPTTPTRVPVACPARIDDLLRRSPDGPVPVLHDGPVAAYVDVGGQVVGLVGTGGFTSPITMRYPGFSGSPFMGARPYLERGVLHAGVRAFVTGRIVDVRAPRIGLDGNSRSKASPAARRGAPPLLAAGLAHLPSRVSAGSVSAMVGRGDGLTPLGDDVICGWLALHRAAGVTTTAVDHALRRLLPRTTRVSAALLESALLGEVSEAVGDHLRALGTPDEDATRQRLLAVGHTSGAGLAHGIDLALSDLTHERRAA